MKILNIVSKTSLVLPISAPLKNIANVSKRNGNALQCIFNALKMHCNGKTCFSLGNCSADENNGLADSRQPTVILLRLENPEYIQLTNQTPTTGQLRKCHTTFQLLEQFFYGKSLVRRNWLYQKRNKVVLSFHKISL